MLKPTHTFTHRPGTQDADVIKEVMLMNEYRLPDRMDGQVVMDIGAHIGSFAFACLSRGAKTVICVEPDWDNFNLLARNMEPFRSRVDAFCKAAWRSDTDEREVYFSGYPWNMTACGTVVPGTVVNNQNIQRPVPAVKFDMLIALALQHTGGKNVSMVKMDCEGSEWYLLGTSRHLSRIDTIVGEAHELEGLAFPGSHGHPEWRCTAEILARHMENSGFSVVLKPLGIRRHLFFASNQNSARKESHERPDAVLDWNCGGDSGNGSAACQGYSDDHSQHGRAGEGSIGPKEAGGRNADDGGAANPGRAPSDDYHADSAGAQS